MALALRTARDSATPGAIPDHAHEARRHPGPMLHVVGGAASIELDRKLLALSARAARCRLVEGRVAAPLLARRSWLALGFVRLSDYARERLGLGARTIEESVRVASALEALPRTAAAFLDGELSWTATRLLVGVAGPSDEAQWIDTARGLDTRTLATTIREHRLQERTPSEPPDPPAAAVEEDEPVRWSVPVTSLGRRMWRAAHELAERVSGSRLSQAHVLELVAAEASGRGSPTLQDDCAAVEDASVAAIGDCDETARTISHGGSEGEPSGPSTPHWRETLRFRDPELAAFLDAAERDDASVDADREDPSVDADREHPPVDEDAHAEPRSYDWREGLAERDPQLAAFLAEVERASALDAACATDSTANAACDRNETASPACEAAPARSFGDILAEVAASEGFPWLVPPPQPADASDHSAWLDRHMHAVESVDPFVIDERLREVRSRMQGIDFELASLLREATRRRLYRELGFRSLEDYVETRLGICSRTAWTLLAIERTASRTSPLLADAWRDGRISTMAAHMILRMLGYGHDDLWIERARSVMLRRLASEVEWGLARLAERRDAEPPPDDVDLAAAALAGVTAEELQKRAQQAPSGDTAATPTDFSPSDRITFFAPKSVCVLAEETMFALREGSEPRGSAFERMLALALLEWIATPRHRDPVFERDGFRCAAPGCTSRCNLHDHHVRFRSLGGGGALTNRLTVCAAHHLHGLHRGRIRARGSAPHGVAWEMGIRFGPGGGTPLFRTIGDRYV